MLLRKIINWLRGHRAERAPGENGVAPHGPSPLLIVITPEQEVPNELRTIKKLLDAGLPRLHLRRHDWGVDTMRDWIESIPKKHHGRLVVHGHPELVAEYGLAGCHLQAGKPKPKHAPAGVVFSRSCHDYEELRHGPHDCAYATLGPVFPSVSKRGYAPRRTPEEFAAIVDYWRVENKGHPVVALGGITPENIGSLRRMGFAGAAVVGAVWESENPVEAYRALRRGWDE